MSLAHGQSFAGYTIPRAPVDQVVVTNLVHEFAAAPTASHRTASCTSPRRTRTSTGGPRSTWARSPMRARSAARGRRYDSRALLDLDGMLAAALATGLELPAREAIMIKLLPNALMATLPDEVVKGLVLAARHFPDHSVMHYLVLRRRPERATA